ncbi:hypothetical protein, partial [Shewanella sp. CG12_big_fil_rev_8_21_14_0_65_47_15]|uniref:hypothetical protein n=1 Tax=Shewanella sp. CG12_big_fil_rev_8_21_14_0_65_47_15 TaxID=1975537 RepID=UPI0025DD875D
YVNAKKVSQGDLRDDRPPPWMGRSSIQGGTCCVSVSEHHGLPISRGQHLSYQTSYLVVLGLYF